MGADNPPSNQEEPLVAKIFLFLMIALSLLTADIAHSCPAFLKASNLPAWTLESTPKNLGLFVFGTSKKWERLPLQVDPMTEQDIFDNSRHATAVSSKIQPNDRLVFYTEKFGAILSDKTPLPCTAAGIAELRAPNNTFAYIANCINSQSATSRNDPTIVSLDTQTRTIASNKFQYIYHPKNQLLYESLIAHTTTGKSVRSAYDSDIGIRLDIKNFFTLHFTNGDLESYINSSKIGELGVVQGVAFYLRLFAFKIDLKMNTVASFFESGANIPMTVDVPADAHKHLNPGSGSLYSLKLDQAEFQMDHPLSTMPNFEGKLLKSGAPEVKEAGLRRCKGNLCNYKMMGKVDERPFALSMTVPRETVEMGFFPTFVYDVGEFKNDIGWKGGEKSTNNERAIFFPTHGLSKGKYQIDSWILLGDASTSSVACPVPVAVTPARYPALNDAVGH
jgi:hypothetical protein